MNDDINKMEECQPISHLKDIGKCLKNPPKWLDNIIPLQPRSPFVIHNDLNDCHSSLDTYRPKQRVDRRLTPKTLICHDYKGGYLADRFVTRTNMGNNYTFYNWSLIDTFIYFSHHLITIPPIVWINVAHKNGVKILGTFITENLDGQQICDIIFKNDETIKIMVEQLCEIMITYKFDGYLLNIENSIKNVEILKKFIKLLNDEMHRIKNGSILIWYDSVIEDGLLKWQNELNTNNQCFFDLCDGIFLNYVWTEANLIKSVEIAKQKQLNVYVGIDVFGRNTYGGGEFNTCKAIEMINRYKLSIAIFAPGWVHEKLSTNENGQKFFENFLNRDLAFWNSLRPYLYTHPIIKYFSTNFFIGMTKNLYDLTNQHKQLSILPTPKNLEIIPEYTDVPQLNNRCNCLISTIINDQITCEITCKSFNQQSIHRLFYFDLQLNKNFLIFYTYLNNFNVGRIVLHLFLCNNHNDSYDMIICGDKIINNMKNCLECERISDESLNKQLKTNANDGIEIYKFNLKSSCTLMEIGCSFEKNHTITLTGFGIQPI